MRSRSLSAKAAKANAEQSPGDSKQEAFGKQLPHKAHATRAKGLTHGELARSCS